MKCYLFSVIVFSKEVLNLYKSSTLSMVSVNPFFFAYIADSECGLKAHLGTDFNVSSETETVDGEHDRCKVHCLNSIKA